MNISIRRRLATAMGLSLSTMTWHATLGRLQRSLVILGTVLMSGSISILADTKVAQIPPPPPPPQYGMPKPGFPAFSCPPVQPPSGAPTLGGDTIPPLPGDGPGCMPLTSREENNSPPYDGSQGDGTNPTDSSPDPISLATGNNRVDETDVMIPCPVLPLELRRSYNSLCSAQAEPLGYGWHHGYDWQVGLISSVVATQPILKDGNIYLSDPSLTGVADIMPRVQTVTQTFLLVQAMCNLNEAPYKGDYLWFMRKADGSFLACNPQNNRYEARSVWGGGYQVLVPGGVVYTFGANGLLSSISHPCGVQVTLEYESLPGSKPQLRTVRHSNGKCLEFQYSGTRLARINTPDPSVYVEYVHNGAGDLTDVVRHGVAASNTFRYVYQEDGEHSRHWLGKRRNPVGEEFSYRYRADSRPTAPAVMSKGPAGEYSTWLDFPDKGHTTMTLERDGET